VRDYLFIISGRFFLVLHYPYFFFKESTDVGWWWIDFCCRYVRCIKPNSNKQADTYSDNMVLDQLRYLGMLDIIRIRREGYPVHLELEVFVDSYKCLCKGLFLPKCPREAVPKMLQKLNFAAKEWQVHFESTWILMEFNSFIVLNTVTCNAVEVILEIIFY